MKVRQTVEFDQSNSKLGGFVDYGKDSTQKALADHALVFIYVPLFSNWVQPITSKGAAPGDVLARLVLEAVLELFKQNAVVIAVVSDGAGSNKVMWAQISGRWKAAVNKVKHPCFPGKHLHFLCDAPHMIKCMRNHLHKHTVAQAGNCEVAYDHYHLLYKAE
ncbi:hypothetical protein MTO96_041181 [Rhipicephalus appendiculatus]